MTAKDPLETIMEVTYELGRIFRHRMAAIAKGPEGVNFLQLHAMSIIDMHPGITMKELAEHLHVTSPSATSFVNRLVKLHWVRRFHDKQNRKLVRLGITDAGKNLLKSKQRKRREIIHSVLQLLDEKDQKALSQILETLYRRYAAAHPTLHS